MSHGADSVKSIFFALGANIAIALAKMAAALFTNSGSMMAESIHSFADSGNQLLLLLGLRTAGKPPSPDFPLGYGKAIYFWSFIVALILFSMGGIYSIYEGIHKLRHPHELSWPLVAVAVLLFSIAAESVSLWGCLREVNKERGRRGLIRWFRETRQSELLVVFGEDTAAILGLVLALVAIITSWITGNPVYDAYGSMAIGSLLIIIAILIGVEVKALLIGQGVEPAINRQMNEWLQSRNEVDTVYNLLTMQLGKDVMVAIKARMREQQSIPAMIADINRCEAEFKKTFPQVLWLFFEPDDRE